MYAHLIHCCTCQFQSCFKLVDFDIHGYTCICYTAKILKREREHANLYNIVKPAAYDRNMNQYDLLSCKQKLNK